MGAWVSYAFTWVCMQSQDLQAVNVCSLELLLQLQEAFQINL